MGRKLTTAALAACLQLAWTQPARAQDKAMDALMKEAGPEAVAMLPPAPDDYYSKVVPAAKAPAQAQEKRGVFLDDNPTFRVDWDATAEHARATYPDGSPTRLYFNGGYVVRVGKRTLGIGSLGEEMIGLYPDGAARNLLLWRRATALNVGGTPYVFLSRLCTSNWRYSHHSSEYEEHRNCFEPRIGLHENGEIKSGTTVTMRDGCPIKVSQVAFDAEGKLMGETDVETILGYGKPSFPPDFRQEYEQALRQDRP